MKESGEKGERMIPNEEIDLVSMLNQGEFDLARQSIREKEDMDKKKQKMLFSEANLMNLLGTYIGSIVINS